MMIETWEAAKVEEDILPWKALIPGAKGDPLPWRHVVNSNGDEVCCVWNEPGTHGAVAERRARLIAAAPDLLAAVQAVLFPAGDTPEQLREQMLAAVKKATA